MKKITFLALVLLGFNGVAQTILSHSTTQDVTPGTTVACPTEPTNYLRVFDLVNEFGINDGYTIDAVEFGVEIAETVPVTINLYTADGTDPTSATLTLVYTGVQEVLATDEGTVVTHTLTAPVIIDSGSILVFEIAESIDGVIFRIGSNQSGQTAPSWLTSPTCGAGTVESFGFTNHYVVNIVGDLLLNTTDFLSSNLELFPNPVQDELTVNLPNSIEVKSAVFYDVLGKQTELALIGSKINTSSLSSGVYILAITTDQGTVNRKVVKN